MATGKKRYNTRNCYFAVMDIDELRSYCSHFPGVTEDIKWEVHLTFCIGGKMFCIADLEEPFGYAFKSDPDDFEELAGRNGIVPAPHLARAQWVKVLQPGALGRKEAEEKIRRSYDLVAAKLTKKLRAELGI